MKMLTQRQQLWSVRIGLANDFGAWQTLKLQKRKLFSWILVSYWAADFQSKFIWTTKIILFSKVNTGKFFLKPSKVSYADAGKRYCFSIPNPI